MELQSLRAFVEVVRQGGFSSATRTLFATQSTVSKAIRQLEDEAGTPLLVRLKQGVRMTAAGEVVYRRAIAILAERERLVAELGEVRGLQRGILRLGLPPLGSSVLFAKLFKEFRGRYRGIEIQLLELGGVRLEQAVLGGEIELAVSLLPAPAAFESQAIRDEPMVALLPSEHPLVSRSALRLKELEATPLLLFEAGFALNAVIESACERRGFTPREGARSSQVDFIVALVDAGLGVALLPRSIAEQWAHPASRVIPLEDEDLRWRPGLIWKREVPLSGAARAWLELASSPPGSAGRAP